VGGEVASCGCGPVCRPRELSVPRATSSARSAWEPSAPRARSAPHTPQATSVPVRWRGAPACSTMQPGESHRRRAPPTRFWTLRRPALDSLGASQPDLAGDQRDRQRRISVVLENGHLLQQGRAASGNRQRLPADRLHERDSSRTAAEGAAGAPEDEYVNPKTLKRNSLGIAVGGLRLPEVEVPVVVDLAENFVETHPTFEVQHRRTGRDLLQRARCETSTCGGCRHAIGGAPPADPCSG
jgi:hypothetical protein